MKTTSVVILTALCLVLSNSVHAACKSTQFVTQQTRTDSSYGIHNLETVDYDSDGILDVVGLINSDSTSSRATLYAWRGLGDGTFAVPVSLGTTGVQDLAVADVNNDGKMDLVMAVSDTAAQLVVRLGDGTTFGTAISQSLSYTPKRLVTVPFDGDAFLDLIVTANTNQFRVYHGDGAGHFAETRTVSTETMPGAVAAADFDGDGRVDVAYANFNSVDVHVVFKNSDGSFTPSTTLHSSDPGITDMTNFVSRLAAADLNEDGRADLVAANWQSEPATASVVYFLSSAGRTFTRTAMTPRMSDVGSTFFMVRATDVDGDGHADITASALNGGVIMSYAGKGDGSFYSPTYFRPTQDSIYSFAFGDFDGDGDTDVAAGSYGLFHTGKGSCATQVSLYSQSPVVTYGKVAPLRTIVSGIGSDTALPRGTVTFSEGETNFGSADVDPSGYAVLDVAGMSIGTHSVTAHFDGASSATSQTITQKVTAQSSTTTITFPAAPSVYGTLYSITVTVLDQRGQNFGGTWFTLDVDGTRSSRISNAAIPLLLSPGPHTITAFYAGDILTPASDSGPQAVTTGKATPTLATVGGLNVRSGQSSTLNLTVSGPQGVTGPTGTVNFMEGSSLLSTASVTNGSATLSRTFERGNHEITALYSGDGNFHPASLSVTLTVLPDLVAAIDARSLPNAISIRALLPNAATSVVLYRSPAGAGTWSVVSGWTPQYEYDTAVPLRGVLYDYKLTLMSGGVAMTSNIDPAMLFTDETLVAAATLIKRAHFDELRAAVNGLRSVAGLPPFNFDDTYLGTIVHASHLQSLRTALTEARQTLGMSPAVYTDETLAGTPIKAAHIQEIRSQAF